MKKIYLDTCIFSKLLQDNIDDDQLASLEELSNYEEISLVTSQKTLDEVSDTPDIRRRRSLKLLFKFVKQVYAPPHTRNFSPLFGDAPFGAPWGQSGTITEEIYSRLLKVFKPDDSEHIYNAKKAECDYFLTLDYKSLLKKIPNNEKEIRIAIDPMKIVDPISLVEELESNKVR